MKNYSEIFSLKLSFDTDVFWRLIPVIILMLLPQMQFQNCWSVMLMCFVFFQFPLWLITRCWETLLPQEKLQTHAEQTNPLFMYFLEHKYKHRASVGLLHNSSLMHHQILQSSAILASSLWLLFVSLYGVHQLIMQHRNSP